MIEMSPIEVDAHPMDVAHDPEVFLTAARFATNDDLPENVHLDGKWLINIILGLLLWGLIFWAVL